jgi:hypothetical protein
MIKSETSIKKNFKEFLIENLKGIISIRPLLGFMGISIVAIVKINFDAYLTMISNPWTWIIFVALVFVDAILGAVYWHFYIRSSRYKRQQERANKSENDE